MRKLNKDMLFCLGADGISTENFYCKENKKQILFHFDGTCDAITSDEIKLNNVADAERTIIWTIEYLLLEYTELTENNFETIYPSENGRGFIVRNFTRMGPEDITDDMCLDNLIGEYDLSLIDNKELKEIFDNYNGYFLELSLNGYSGTQRFQFVLRKDLEKSINYVENLMHLMNKLSTEPNNSMRYNNLQISVIEREGEIQMVIDPVGDIDFNIEHEEILKEEKIQEDKCKFYTIGSWSVMPRNNYKLTEDDIKELEEMKNMSVDEGIKYLKKKYSED